MRVFSQIDNCQQKQNKKQKQKTDKTKRGAPVLGLAKSIYYEINRGIVKRGITLLSGTPFYPWISYSRDKEFNRGLTANRRMV